jgi:membrane protease YdiL (CAAX protease family)
LATFALGLAALLAGQTFAIVALVAYYGAGIGQLPELGGDGVAVTLIIAVSTPVQVMLLFLFAWRRSVSAIDYLGLTAPTRNELIFGFIAVVALIAVGNLLSWLLGQDIVTPFQSSIYRTASAAGWLPLLWLAVVVVTPIGEETLFRGFLFRGWLRSPRDAWPVIVIVALGWALIHVQYDWYIIFWVFVSGLLLGWLRWATGSTILTILLHGLINFEAMLESLVMHNG